jgi:hypothetical protein
VESEHSDQPEPDCCHFRVIEVWAVTSGRCGLFSGFFTGEDEVNDLAGALTAAVW